MKYIRRYNESRTIKATDNTIYKIVRYEKVKLGNNGDLNHIDVSEVTNMIDLFNRSRFNGDISKWNVSNVRNMNGMFWYSKFNGDLTYWNVSRVENMNGIFYGSPLQKKEPWWYKFSPLFGGNKLLWDSLEFEWIDIEKKIIYKDKLIKTLKRGYNTKWDGEFPEVSHFTYQ